MHNWTGFGAFNQIHAIRPYNFRYKTQKQKFDSQNVFRPLCDPMSIVHSVGKKIKCIRKIWKTPNRTIISIFHGIHTTPLLTPKEFGIKMPKCSKPINKTHSMATPLHFVVKTDARNKLVITSNDSTAVINKRSQK